ncbi:hypothetical protein [Aggregatilinea lenta]|uniref:hypothetical protein n=1 Tax=Aggregatilinea lenta TaxID=913108 RepID=UPI000E5A9733|nr:hypothetical protein [Aggregatilinea lenta]
MMRKAVLFGVGVLVMGLAALPVGAQGPSTGNFPPNENTEWGEPVDFGEGQAQTFVTLDSSEKPELVGIYFTEGMLSDLPAEPGDGHWDVLDAEGNVVIPCCGHEVVLEFPDTIAGTTIKSFVMNWNPMGHPPAHIYDVPHFDLHFYTITNEERIAIEVADADTMCMVPNPPDTPGEHPVLMSCETFEQATIPLPDSQMPPSYMDVGEVAPGMGNHLVNPTALEFTGEAFTHTWIYGTYGGKLTFLEPMIANSFLDEHNEEACAEIALPEEMAEPGYYPSRYCIRYMDGLDGADGTFAITLESFVEF